MVYKVFHINELENPLFHKSWSEPSYPLTTLALTVQCPTTQNKTDKNSLVRYKLSMSEKTDSKAYEVIILRWALGL